jgi:dUTP pyrophosphatase
MSNSSHSTLKIKKLTVTSIIPERKSEGAAGYDLYSDEKVILEPSNADIIGTGISIQLPEGTYGRIAPRSSLSLKLISVEAGVVDRDYRGEIKVMLFNQSSEDFVIKPGDRIAQLIIEKIETPLIEVVEELDDTIRGAGGFGSTGK